MIYVDNTDNKNDLLNGIIFNVFVKLSFYVNYIRDMRFYRFIHLGVKNGIVVKLDAPKLATKDRIMCNSQDLF